MTSLCCEVLDALKGKTLATAESCTGGGIGAALTAVPGCSDIYKGGIISYTNEVKAEILGVSREVLERCGAVSAPVAEAMAKGVRERLRSDVAVSVTGLAGPGGDDSGNEIGTVYIGFSGTGGTVVEKHVFAGDREAVRRQAVEAALKMILRNATD